jgi:hypothetical protein
MISFLMSLMSLMMLLVLLVVVLVGVVGCWLLVVGCWLLVLVLVVGHFHEPRKPKVVREFGYRTAAQHFILTPTLLPFISHTLSLPHKNPLVRPAIPPRSTLSHYPTTSQYSTQSPIFHAVSVEQLCPTIWPGPLVFRCSGPCAAVWPLRSRMAPTQLYGPYAAVWPLRSCMAWTFSRTRRCLAAQRRPQGLSAASQLRRAALAAHRAYVTAVGSRHNCEFGHNGENSVPGTRLACCQSSAFRVVRLSHSVSLACLRLLARESEPLIAVGGPTQLFIAVERWYILEVGHPSSSRRRCEGKGWRRWGRGRCRCRRSAAMCRTTAAVVLQAILLAFKTTSTSHQRNGVE